MIIYKAVNKVNGKIYIGQTSSNNPNYLGSGSYITRAIEKYGKENFEKEVMAWCYTKEHLDFLEKFYIKLFDSKAPNGYNLADGGDGGPRMFGDSNPSKRPEVREQQSKSGKEAWTDTRRREEASYRMTGDNNPAKRSEVREKIRKYNIGKKRPNMSGENSPTKRLEVRKKIGKASGNARRGKKRPNMSGENSPTKRLEVRKKISESHKGKKRLNSKIRSDKGRKRCPYKKEKRN